MSIKFESSDNQYLTSATSSSYDPATTGTVSFWVNRTVAEVDSAIFSVYLSSTFRVFFNSDDEVEANLFTKSTKPFTSSATFSTTNVWYHMALTWEPVSNSTIALYVDGVLDSSDSNLSGTVSANMLEIGRTGSTYSDMILEDFRIYHRKLAQDEIETIFACRGTDGISDSLVRRFMLNEGSQWAGDVTWYRQADTTGNDDMVRQETLPTSMQTASSELKFRRSV